MDYQEIISTFEDKKSFFTNNNFHIVNCEGDVFEIRADLTDYSFNPYGFAHGGLIFGLGDTAMGMLARKTGKKAVTRSANISYLKPALGKYITAKAEIVKAGLKVCLLKADIYNDKEEIVAVMTADYYFID